MDTSGRRMPQAGCHYRTERATQVIPRAYRIAYDSAVRNPDSAAHKCRSAFWDGEVKLASGSTGLWALRLHPGRAHSESFRNLPIANSGEYRSGCGGQVLCTGRELWPGANRKQVCGCWRPRHGKRV
jgi:hypothetical protein